MWLISLLLKKCPREFTKNVHENSPKQCPRKFTHFVNENSPFHLFETWSIKIISCTHLDVFAFNILRFLLQELKRKKTQKKTFHLFLFAIRILWISKLNLCNSDKIFHCGIRMRCYYCIIKVTEKKFQQAEECRRLLQILELLKYTIHDFRVSRWPLEIESPKRAH